MATPELALVLHGHLPFIRHPEHPEFLEERWLFEAITETYVPLLRAFDALASRGSRFRLTLSISPTLAAMLSDALLAERYLRHLERLLALAGREVARTAGDGHLAPLARLYEEQFAATRHAYLDTYGGDLLGAFARLERRGVLELITSAATHAFLPLLGDARLVRAQLLVAVAEHERHFGRRPAGLWLPECAFSEGLDAVLADAGLSYFFTDSHGVLHATPRPAYGVFAPIVTPSGVAVFGRDPECSSQVWSATEGYPGDPWYREFYRDVGFDLDLEYLRPFLPADGTRTSLGIKYHRITGAGERKEPYDRARALERVETHATDFVGGRLLQAARVSRLMPERSPLFVAPYDAELFGHWWFEGPEWLASVLRRAALPTSGLRLVTPSDYLDARAKMQEAAPATSTWGDGGYAEVWLNPANDWIYPHLHGAARRFLALAGERRGAGDVARRALAQAGRELLLAESSDWAFIMRAGTHVAYATRRTREHVANVMRLCDEIAAGAVDLVHLTELEARHNLFPALDPDVFAATAR